MPGQDLLVQAVSGVMFNTGRASDPPTPCGNADSGFCRKSGSGDCNSGSSHRPRPSRHRPESGNQPLFGDTQLNGDRKVSPFSTRMLNSNAQSREWLLAGMTPPYGAHPTSDGWVAIAMCPLEKTRQTIRRRSACETIAHGRNATKSKFELTTAQEIGQPPI